MSKSEVIFNEVLNNRDLNTSPLTISGLKGDFYDYDFIFFTEGSTTFSENRLYFNADTGTQYRRYNIQSRGATASAGTDDADTQINIGETGSTGKLPHLVKGSIRGASGNERHVQLFISENDNTDSKVNLQDSFWKNTANELTSMTFSNSVATAMNYHIIVFRTPKDSGQGDWEIVEDVSFTSQDLSVGMSPIDISNLDGDRDGQYRILWDADNGGGGSIMGMQINADAGTSYSDQELQNNGGTVSAQARVSATEIILQQGEDQKAEAVINAETGQKRLIDVSSSKFTGAFQQLRHYWLYSNSGTNITSLRFVARAGSSTVYTGRVKVYRKKKVSVPSDTLPFRIRKETSFSGDFTAGVDFTGLKGNDVLMYKLEWEAITSANVAQNMEFQINNDSGASAYTRQKIDGNGSTVATTGTGNDSKISTATMGRSGEPHKFTAYIYPNATGADRPMLIEYFRAEDVGGVLFTHREFATWNNSTDEITSIKVFTTNSDVNISGKVRLSELKIHYFFPFYQNNFLINILVDSATTKHYWTMDEASGNRVDDYNSVALVEDGGTPPGVSGKYNNAISFTIANTEVIRTPTIPLTRGNNRYVDAWVLVDASGFQDIIYLNHTTGNRRTFELYVRGAQFAFGTATDNDAGTAFSADSVTTITAATWYHISSFLDGTSLVLAQNGIQVASATVSGTFSGTGHDEYTVGGRRIAAVNSNYFGGDFDEHKVLDDITFGGTFPTGIEMALERYNQGVGIFKNQ